MIVYHEANPESYDSLITNGLKRTSRGDKTNSDPMIQQTDKLLDQRRPVSLIAAHVSRDNNIYAYVAKGETIQDITDGSFIPVVEFIQKSKQLVLAMNVDPQRCFVSDLDQYDALKIAIKQRQSQPTLHKLADEYWHSLILLSEYELHQKTRAEIMITYDIAPTNITSIWNKP